MAGTLLALIGLIGGGVAWWQTGQEADVGSSTDVAATATGAGSEALEADAMEAEAAEPIAAGSEREDDAREAGVDASKDSAVSAAAAASPTPAKDVPKANAPRQAPAPAEPAELTVIVFPWGKVWLNGKLIGSAPIRNRTLRPGRYKVSVGQEAPVKTESVRLRPRQRKSLKFDLTQ
jgi:hypothetical protein